MLQIKCLSKCHYFQKPTLPWKIPGYTPEKQLTANIAYHDMMIFWSFYNFDEGKNTFKGFENNTKHIRDYLRKNNEKLFFEKWKSGKFPCSSFLFDIISEYSQNRKLGLKKLRKQFPIFPSFRPGSHKFASYKNKKLRKKSNECFPWYLPVERRYIPKFLKQKLYKY